MIGWSLDDHLEIEIRLGWGLNCRKLVQTGFWMIWIGYTFISFWYTDEHFWKDSPTTWWSVGNRSDIDSAGDGAKNYYKLVLKRFNIFSNWIYYMYFHFVFIYWPTFLLTPTEGLFHHVTATKLNLTGPSESRAFYQNILWV